MTGHPLFWEHTFDLASAAIKRGDFFGAAKIMAADGLYGYLDAKLHQSVTPFGYDIDSKGSWCTAQFGTVSEMKERFDNNPFYNKPEMQAEKARDMAVYDRVLELQSAFNKPNLKQGIVVSPSLENTANGESRIYLYEKSGNKIIALDVVFKGTHEQLNSLVEALNQKANGTKTGVENALLGFTVDPNRKIGLSDLAGLVTKMFPEENLLSTFSNPDFQRDFEREIKEISELSEVLAKSIQELFQLMNLKDKDSLTKLAEECMRLAEHLSNDDLKAYENALAELALKFGKISDIEIPKANLGDYIKVDLGQGLVQIDNKLQASLANQVILNANLLSSTLKSINANLSPTANSVQNNISLSQAIDIAMKAMPHGFSVPVLTELTQAISGENKESQTTALWLHPKLGINVVMTSKAAKNLNLSSSNQDSQRVLTEQSARQIFNSDFINILVNQSRAENNSHSVLSSAKHNEQMLLLKLKKLKSSLAKFNLFVEQLKEQINQNSIRQSLSANTAGSLTSIKVPYGTRETQSVKVGERGADQVKKINALLEKSSRATKGYGSTKTGKDTAVQQYHDPQNNKLLTNRTLGRNTIKRIALSRLRSVSKHPKQNSLSWQKSRVLGEGKVRVVAVKNTPRLNSKHDNTRGRLEDVLDKAFKNKTLKPNDKLTQIPATKDTTRLSKISSRNSLLQDDNVLDSKQSQNKVLHAKQNTELNELEKGLKAIENIDNIAESLPRINALSNDAKENKKLVSHAKYNANSEKLTSPTKKHAKHMHKTRQSAKLDALEQFLYKKLLTTANNQQLFWLFTLNKKRKKKDSKFNILLLALSSRLGIPVATLEKRLELLLANNNRWDYETILALLVGRDSELALVHNEMNL